MRQWGGGGGGEGLLFGRRIPCDENYVASFQKCFLFLDVLPHWDQDVAHAKKQTTQTEEHEHESVGTSFKSLQCRRVMPQ